ncbi:MAG TPA: hypothetical protein VF629_05840, partial [Hymenobacter sp.]|uniref:hypothetical protein n=1 Tax=Hymenobacter sp. TaxID=1898978 RepID=UPI002ED7DB9F
FGMELKYDTDLQTGSATPRYNGNIAENMWNSRRDAKLRGYGYHYDNSNRLSDAWYAAYDYIGGNWGWNG